jgi:hypothetical protein
MVVKHAKGRRVIGGLTTHSRVAAFHGHDISVRLVK